MMAHHNIVKFTIFRAFSLAIFITMLTGANWLIASAGEQKTNVKLAEAAVSATMLNSPASLQPTESTGENNKHPARLQGATVFRIHRDKNRIKLRGPAPTEEDKKIVLGMIEANFPGFKIVDRTKIDGRHNKSDSWLSGVSFVLRQLALLRSGAAQIAENRISLAGVAETAENYKLVQKSLSSEMPKGLLLENGSIKPPDEDYTWLAQLREGSVIISGHVPDEAAKKALSELAEFLFPEARFDNKTQVAIGAPDDWIQAAQVSLRALRLLQSGSVSIASQILKVDGVPANGEAENEIEALNELLPKGFAIENEIVGSERVLLTPFAID